MTRIIGVSAERLMELNGQGHVDLIDVRTPVEFREVRAANARNLPLDSLDPHAVMKEKEQNGTANDPLYVICRSGNRSAKACQQFMDAGYTNVVNVDGGTRTWDESGLPVVRGTKTVSLERQVRIAAGLLVLLGTVLGLFVNPYFIGLSAFVGAGLMFAGITDTCGMGMMLAKMPWNRRCQEATSCNI
ncbi:MAG: rhodanese-like domain-containing protein [Fuerstiella sp.]|nr:rhodanese-like domain-containing protein [Fuerstiella sp.]MCP4856272.1 rhodanese-like domain-containing protein [Fuerstiella sp.]